MHMGLLIGLLISAFTWIVVDSPDFVFGLHFFFETTGSYSWYSVIEVPTIGSQLFFDFFFSDRRRNLRDSGTI